MASRPRSRAGVASRNAFAGRSLGSIHRVSPLTGTDLPIVAVVVIAAWTWIVDRTFFWLGRYRRFSNGYEDKMQISKPLIGFVPTHLLFGSLAA